MRTAPACLGSSIAVELTSSNDTGASDRLQTWIVAGDGRVVAHLEDPLTKTDQD